MTICLLSWQMTNCPRSGCSITSPPPCRQVRPQCKYFGFYLDGLSRSIGENTWRSTYHGEGWRRKYHKMRCRHCFGRWSAYKSRKCGWVLVYVSQLSWKWTVVGWQISLLLLHPNQCQGSDSAYSRVHRMIGTFCLSPVRRGGNFMSRYL